MLPGAGVWDYSHRARHGKRCIRTGRAVESPGGNIHGFLNHYLDFLLSHPTLVYFTLNFGHGVPHIAPLSDDRLVHRVKVIGDAETILSRYGLEPKEDYLLLWSFTLRHLLYFAGYLLNDPQHDSPEMREESEHIILEGLKAFKENR